MSRRRPRPSFGTVVSHLGVILAVSVVLGVLTAGLVVPVVGALGYAASATANSMKNLPEQLTATPLAQRSRVLDSQGRVIATFYDENRVDVPLARVAPIMRKAIVAIEDYRFYQHGALDVKGTLRAFVNNQTDAGSTQGGSSITQQMAKMTLLSQANTPEERRAATENTYQRKIQELRHAIAFEQNYSKDWILERYLNLAYYGDGAYGIQTAARHYFSVDASQLSIPQAATLAGLVKNPVGFDPSQYPDRARARRNVVLERMAQLKVIPQATADKLVTQKLRLRMSSSRNGCLGSPAAFFCDYVRRYLLADPSLGKTPADRQTLLNTGGLTIKTTVDLDFQRAADQATAAAVRPTDQAIGALALVQPGTGAVKAISQSRPMGRDKAAGQTFLDYVVDSKYGDSNGFQAGSTFKAFVLASAIEQGLPTTTRFNSPPKLSIPQNDFADCTGPYPIYSTWNLGNSTGSGSFDMTTGTRKSVNTYYAQLERQTGICEPFALAKAMGVDLTDPGTERIPSFVLGVADVSPLEMAGAYATFAARGKHCTTRPVTEILNSSGKVFKDYPNQCQQVMSERTADTVNAILRGVLEPGGFGQNLALDKPSAGKTGTIDSNKAVWFNGYTPTLATAAMIAGANSSGQPITLNGSVVGGSYVGEAFGSTLAGPMWASAMRAVQDKLPYEDFQPPYDGNADPVQITVPDVTGLSRSRATEILAGLGFYVDLGPDKQSSERRGRIADTSPAPGQAAPRGTHVAIYPSGG